MIAFDAVGFVFLLVIIIFAIIYSDNEKKNTKGK